MAARDDSIPKHHIKQQWCLTRPKYRDGRKSKAVKVYTISQESAYLLIHGVPAVGAMQDLIRLFALYGEVEEYRVLDEYPDIEEFTETYWIKFKQIQAARTAKRKLDDYSFCGGNLHIHYAPEYETVEDTRQKLQGRRKVIAGRIRDLEHEGVLEPSQTTKDGQSYVRRHQPKSATDTPVSINISLPSEGPQPSSTEHSHALPVNQSQLSSAIKVMPINQSQLSSAIKDMVEHILPAQSQEGLPVLPGGVQTCQVPNIPPSIPPYTEHQRLTQATQQHFSTLSNTPRFAQNRQQSYYSLNMSNSQRLSHHTQQCNFVQSVSNSSRFTNNIQQRYPPPGVSNNQVPHGPPRTMPSHTVGETTPYLPYSVPVGQLEQDSTSYLGSCRPDFAERNNSKQQNSCAMIDSVHTKQNSGTKSHSSSSNKVEVKIKSAIIGIKQSESELVVREYVAPKKTAPRFIPRQAQATNKTVNKEQTPVNSQDKLNSEIKQNACVLGSVQGPQISEEDKKEIVKDTLLTGDPSMEETVKTVRNKIKSITSESCGRPVKKVKR